MSVFGTKRTVVSIAAYVIIYNSQARYFISNQHNVYTLKIKVTRADKHVTGLNLFIIDFMKNNFCELLIENNVLKLKSNIKELPTEIPLILGDAIHNLRAFLDLLVCDIVTK